MEHLLLSCPWVEPIWFGGPLNYKVNRASVTTLVAWLYSLIESNLGSKDDILRNLSYVAFTYWHIWKARCTSVFNHKIISPQQILMFISISVGGFLEAS